MIRIAHTSDLHIDERGRLADVVLVLDSFLEQAREADVHLIVVAGDHFERRSTPTERNVLATFLQEAAAIAPVWCVKGNHDAAEDLTIFGHLETDVISEIVVMDRPTAMPGSAHLIDIGNTRRLALLALPWFDRAHLVAGLAATVDSETTRLMTIAAAQDLLTCLRAEAERARGQGSIPILAAHIQVAGSEVATGQTLIGTSVELTPADLLDVDAACVLLGHIHMSQAWFEGRVAYSGSPNRCNFGESEPKGWRLVTLTDKGDFVSSEFRELPARRMVLLEEDWTDPIKRAIGFVVEPTDVDGALVRVRYRIGAQNLHLVDQAALERSVLALGAHEVRLEAIVEAETRVRSEEIAHVQSTSEKLDLYLEAKAITVDEAGCSRLHSKLEQLEAGA